MRTASVGRASSLKHGQTRELSTASSNRPPSWGDAKKQELVGRADNSGTRGFGCWLWISRPHATSSYTVGMRLAGRHLTCPTVIHPSDHLLSRVPPRYARVRTGSTDFTECGRDVRAAWLSAPLATPSPARPHAHCASSAPLDDGVSIQSLLALGGMIDNRLRVTVRQSVGRGPRLV